MDPFLGEIRLFAGNFAPNGWALCNGQIMSIAQNTALFSLLGTTYGGNGQTTFALPDLRGRVPVHAGQGPNLSNYSLGQQGGVESVTLTTNHMPAHTHTLNASSNDETTNRPTNAVPAKGGVYDGTLNTTMNPGVVGNAGGSQPHENLPPHLTLNYIIALQGIFPSRN
jgi:microcystin-dependent protein